MCGRARLPADYNELKIKLRLEDFSAPNFAPTWNLAPTQDAFCVVYDRESKKRLSRMMRWGFIPPWSKEPKSKFATHNAVGETVDEKPMYMSAWNADRRCLVVTDGFYEWRKSDKQPFAIACVNDQLTVLAGLWQEWKGPTGERISCCTVITTTPNSLLAPVHNRMPVILAERDWPKWLGEVPSTDDEVKSLIRPYSSEEMHLWPVDKRVGAVKNNDASLALEVPIA